MKTPNRYEPHGLFNTPESVETALSNAEHLIGGLSPNERIVGYTIMYTVYNAFTQEFNNLSEQLEVRGKNRFDPSRLDSHDEDHDGDLLSLEDFLTHSKAKPKYLLNGEPVELKAFLEVNKEAFFKEEIEEALALQPGETLTFGGGAAAKSILTRIS